MKVLDYDKSILCIQILIMSGFITFLELIPDSKIKFEERMLCLKMYCWAFVGVGCPLSTFGLVKMSTKNVRSNHIL